MSSMTFLSQFPKALDDILLVLSDQQIIKFERKEPEWFGILFYKGLAFLAY